MFEYAKGKSWCKELVIPDGTLSEMKGNNDPRGYLIYQLDHKLTLRDIPFVFSRINDFPDAYSMLCEFTRISGRQISDDDMAKGMRKFLDAGNVIGCYFDGHLYGMANVYCNHTDSGDAYLCNLEVLSDYRGLGLSKKLMNAAYKLIVDKDFSSVSLDVDRSNKIARNLYENEGFLYTGQSKIVNGETLLEMRKYLVLN